MIEIPAIQSQYENPPPDHSFFRAQPVTHHEILSWAYSYPNGTLLDIAAGFGLEVEALRNEGFCCYRTGTR